MKDFTPKPTDRDDQPSISDWPSFYLYEHPTGEWHRTDERLTREINRHVFLNADFDCAGRAFYPQWPEPANKTATKAAWILRPDGTRSARWAWIERDHAKWHASCELTDKGRCRSRVLVRLSYDPQKKFWTKITNINEIEERKE